ncbi:hypothetical protein VPH35_015674 [Triticum aestivum]
MAAMRVSGQRLRQMVPDAGLRHGAEDRLQTVLETGWWMAAIDANYDSQLDQMIVATSNKFTVLKKLADDITNVHLEVALAARRLALQVFVDLHIHVYEKIAYIGMYKASEDATTLAFLNRLEALDAFAEKHLDLATKAAAP